jgi:hypothetical protein
MPGTAPEVALATPDVKDQEMYVFIVPNNTAPSTLTVPVTITADGSTPITGSATAQTIAVDSVALPQPIQVGQYLCFNSAADGRYLFKVTAVATGTVTELTGIAIEGIPDDATAEFPSRMQGQLSLETSETTGTNTFATWDHDAGADVSRGDASNSLTSSASDGYYNAGMQTIIYASRNGLDVGFVIEIPNEDATAFATPPYDYGVGIVTDVSKTDSNGKMARSLGISVRGAITRTDPVAV